MCRKKTLLTSYTRRGHITEVPSALRAMPFATAAPILALLCAKEIPKRWSTLVSKVHGIHVKAPLLLVAFLLQYSTHTMLRFLPGGLPQGRAFLLPPKTPKILAVAGASKGG
jgi:hypothetical protein